MIETCVYSVASGWQYRIYFEDMIAELEKLMGDADD